MTLNALVTYDFKMLKPNIHFISLPTAPVYASDLAVKALKLREVLKFPQYLNDESNIIV